MTAEFLVIITVTNSRGLKTDPWCYPVVSKMTYSVSSGTLNSTIPYLHSRQMQLLSPSVVLSICIPWLRASHIIAVISATDLLASLLSVTQLIYVANSLCVVRTSQKEIPARPMIYHSCQLASHQLTRYVRCSSVCLMNKFVETQERSFRVMYRKYRKRTTLSCYFQQILFQIMMKYIH